MAAGTDQRRRSSHGLLWGLVVTAVLGGVTSAWAHPQGISSAAIVVEPTRIRYDLALSVHDLTVADIDDDGTLTSEEILDYYPVLKQRFARGLEVESGGEPCPLTLVDFSIDPRRAVVFRLRGPCDGTRPIRLVNRLMQLSGGRGYNLTKVRFPGGVEEYLFTRDHIEVVVGNAPGRWEVLQRFVLLGIEHIATGYDHILFLIALLIVGGGVRALVGIVTSFTVAHSITLALAALDIVVLPSKPVEAAIALSIAWVAAENLLFDRNHGRWRLTFAFGLVHGFGFASILRDLQLSTDALVVALVSFNLGVELGQIAIVLLAYPFILIVQRVRYRRAIVVAVSLATLVLSLVWLWERTLG